MLSGIATPSQAGGLYLYICVLGFSLPEAAGVEANGFGYGRTWKDVSRHDLPLSHRTAI